MKKQEIFVVCAYCTSSKKAEEIVDKFESYIGIVL
jgi:hypothetical protein